LRLPAGKTSDYDKTIIVPLTANEIKLLIDAGALSAQTARLLQYIEGIYNSPVVNARIVAAYHQGNPADPNQEGRMEFNLEYQYYASNPPRWHKERAPLTGFDIEVRCFSLTPNAYRNSVEALESIENLSQEVENTNSLLQRVFNYLRRMGR
jgi:hypothetical protein